MSKRSRELSSEEKRLWRRVAADVKPRPARKLPDDDGEDEPAPAKKTASAPKAIKVTPRPAHKADAPPADRGGERRVKRGQVAIAARLDLHGYTQDGAFAALNAFLQRAYENNARTVLVITGAGRGGEGVLKRSLPRWLEDKTLRPIVSGFAGAHRGHGGAGAIYVFLKRKS